MFDRIERQQLVPGKVSAARVFLAAGSLGTTELLLRARDEHATLPKLSPGTRPALESQRERPVDGELCRCRPRRSVGRPDDHLPVDFMDGADAGHRFVIEDDGFPNLLLNALRASMGAPTRRRQDSDSGVPPRTARGGVLAKDATRGLMLWLGAGVDAGDGELRLDRHWLPPFRRAGVDGT